MLLVIGTAVLLWPTAWDEEEYQVYDIVINQLCLKEKDQIAVIEDHTDFRTLAPWDPSAEGWELRLLQLEYKTRLIWYVNYDFLAKNKKRYPLSSPFNLAVPYEFYPKEEAARLFRVLDDGTTGLDRFHAKYPNSSLLTLSRVGFNLWGNKAVVHVEDVYGGLAGEGYFVFLKKENGKWIIDKQQYTWVS